MAIEFQTPHKRIRITAKSLAIFLVGVILTLVGLVIIPTAVFAGIGIILMIVGLTLAVISVSSTATPQDKNDDQ